MSSTEEKLSKLREERMAREKARIEKLRQLNLKKYSQCDIQPSTSTSSVSLPKSKSGISCSTKNNMKVVTNNVHVNDTTKRPIPAIPKKAINYVIANKNVVSVKSKIANVTIHKQVKPKDLSTIKVDKTDDDKIVNGRKHNPLQEIGIENEIKGTSKIPKLTVTKDGDTNKSKIQQKMLNDKAVVNDNLNNEATNNQSANTNTRSETVFDRLYKPKVLPKQTVDTAQKLQTDPNFLKKVINDSKVIMTRRHSLLEPKVVVPIRRSISAVHFKKINEMELANCVQKWASIGEKIDTVHLQDINEDDHVKEEIVVSAVKSERKRAKVTFQTPSNFNTPQPKELQSRLISWLQKRGKSLESYHHLQCFGVHDLQKEITPCNLDTPKYEINDDENKENIALEHDSDNDSFHENMNEGNDDVAAGIHINFPVDNWRRVSSCNDTVDYSESHETTPNSCASINYVDKLFVGVLNDLTELLREGFEWEQCARWLRLVCERYPSALDSASYWECRAALEERRGDLPASLQCWEHAVANGTQPSVADANLDNLLDKFMQLKISPSSGTPQVDPKLVDVKSIFKSTIIRFGVQQAKLRQSSEPVKFTVTPVRRSSRLSLYNHTPLRVCATLQEAAELGPFEFVPNKALNNTP